MQGRFFVKFPRVSGTVSNNRLHAFAAGEEQIAVIFDRPGVQRDAISFAVLGKAGFLQRVDRRMQRIRRKTQCKLLRVNPAADIKKSNLGLRILFPQPHHH